jgi:hypothetical protein
MNPEQSMSHNQHARQAKYLRVIITIGLGTILLGLVAAYIYYGMQLAKAPTADIVPVETTQVSEDERTRAILEALENAPTEPSANREEVLNALENAPTEPSANREEMLRALNYPGS